MPTIKRIKQLKQSDVEEVRADILAEQNGVCAICGKPPKTPCLDHEHIKRIKGSGQVRGVLCSPCNIFLAKSENNCIRYAIGLRELPRILRAVAKYIEKPHYPLKHHTEAPKIPKLKKASYNKLKKAVKVGYAGKKAFPNYPKSGKVIKALEHFFDLMGITPEYYK